MQGGASALSQLPASWAAGKPACAEPRAPLCIHWLGEPPLAADREVAPWTDPAVLVKGPAQHVHPQSVAAGTVHGAAHGHTCTCAQGLT